MRPNHPPAWADVEADSDDASRGVDTEILEPTIKAGERCAERTPRVQAGAKNKSKAAKRQHTLEMHRDCVRTFQGPLQRISLDSRRPKDVRGLADRLRRQCSDACDNMVHNDLVNAMNKCGRFLPSEASAEGDDWDGNGDCELDIDSVLRQVVSSWC